MYIQGLENIFVKKFVENYNATVWEMTLQAYSNSEESKFYKL